MITDSVGLGSENAMAAAFGPGWQFTLDGDAGEFTETLETQVRAPADDARPHGCSATTRSSPPGTTTRTGIPAGSIAASTRWSRTLLEAGVKHVFWVTLREIKPQYVSPGAWRQIQPYYWYFPTVNDHLEQALARNPSLSLIDWAAVADQPGLTYDAIHLNTSGAALYSAISRQAVIDATTAAAEGAVTRIPIPDARRGRGGGAQPHDRRPAGARLPDRVRLRPARGRRSATTTTPAT